MGNEAGYSNTTGIGNIYLGNFAGRANTTGSYVVFIGASAGRLNTGAGNVFVGGLAGQSNVGGNQNTFLGSSAGNQNTEGSRNLFAGFLAGLSNTTGSQNTFLGSEAGQNTNASANTFIGASAGRSNTTGTFNSFIGVQAGINNTTGNSNYFFGTNSGAGNVSGSGNYFLGDNSGQFNTSGGFNIYIGANSGNGPGVNGNNNMALGFEAGRGNNGGFNNTFVGFRADAGNAGLVNATAIGNNAVVSASNSLVLGNGANVGIGTSTPSAKLHLVTGTANQSGLRLENLTSNSPASVTGQTKFLTVDGSGNVVLGSTTSGGRLGAELWQQKGNYLQNVSGNGVVIGEEIDKTPAGYRLYVQDGILTEKVKVAVKNTSDWSDYVFAKDYPLAPLAEVEQHIQQKGHLPGVPSASEVVEKGIDVAKMDAKLLQKIEELTLYSIQQQKEIDELKKLVKQLLERK
ncbi:hypothetical protein GCM10028817_11980 [Spirosoma pomorum]